MLIIGIITKVKYHKYSYNTIMCELTNFQNFKKNGEYKYWNHKGHIVYDIVYNDNKISQVNISN